MMLRHGGVAYVSHVFTWPEWAAAKEGACRPPSPPRPLRVPLTTCAAAHTFPFDRLPVMDVDGRQIAESGALARLVARWAGAHSAEAAAW